MIKNFPNSKEEIDNKFANPSTYDDLVICKCFDCCGYNPNLCHSLTENDFIESSEYVTDCGIKQCVLYKAIQGLKDYTPQRKYTISDEVRKQRSENMRNIRRNREKKSE